MVAADFDVRFSPEVVQVAVVCPFVVSDEKRPRCMEEDGVFFEHSDPRSPSKVKGTPPSCLATVSACTTYEVPTMMPMAIFSACTQASSSVASAGRTRPTRVPAPSRDQDSSYHHSTLRAR